jgi:uncharacterized repeat protein (TIGR01451 family)
MHKTIADTCTSFRKRIIATASLAALMLGAALPAQAAQIYTTQGYVDYAMNGSGFRLQNSSVTATCSSTADAAYWAASRTFNVTFPATATGIDRAFLIWGGSSDVADTTATLSLNGGAATAVTGTAQTAARPTAPNTRFYETVADVTTQVAAAYAGPGAMSVTVSNVTFKAEAPDNWRDGCGASGGATLVVVYTTNLNNPAVVPRAVVLDDLTVLMAGSNATPATYAGNISGVAAAANPSNGRMSVVTIEGDTSLNVAESFSMTINATTTSYDASVNWDAGDQNTPVGGGNGNSWELDSVNAPTLIIPAGTTAITYNLSSGQDTIMPSVMALSWDVRSDYGDAPASYGVARHSPADLSDTASRLGAGLDFEDAALASADANLDDTTTSDDEGGVTALPLLTVAATTYTISTACAGGTDGVTPVTGLVSAWIDFNRDGAFDNTERAQTTCPSAPSTVNLTWTIAPTQIVAGPSYLRLRIGRVASEVANPTGNATTGEAEDFQLDIVPTITVNKQVWPDSDTGVFNFAVDATSIATDLGDDQSATPRTLYHKQINNYNGMTGVAPSVVVVLNVSTNALNFNLTETGGTGTNLADYTSAYTCVNGAGATVASADPGTSAALTIPLSATGGAANGRQQNITCDFVNQTARIVMVKNTTLGDGTFAFAATGNRVANFNITTVAGTGSTALALQRIHPSTPGNSQTVTETVPAGWRLDSIACTFLAPNGTTGSVGSVTLPAVTVPLTRGYDYTCTFANHKLTADVVLTKTNTPGVNGDVDQPADGVVSGAASNYAIRVVNNGPDGADGTVVTDPVPTNLNCATATCSAAGGAACPVPTGAALVTALQGAGATVPTLPNGGSVTFTLSCTVQ